MHPRMKAKSAMAAAHFELYFFHGALQHYIVG